MRVQTKVMQRNVRTVLILVDGRTSVAELGTKTGNPRMTENALVDLERGGFIMTIEKAVQEEQLTAPVIVEVPLPSVETEVADTNTASEKVHVQRSAWPIDPAIAAQQPPSGPAGDLASTGISGAKVDEKDDRKDREAPRPEARPPSPPISARVRGWWRQHGRRPRAVEKIAVQEKRKIGFKKGIAWIGLGGVASLVFLAAVFPFSIFRTDIESVMARALARPVQVAEIEVTFYPRPGIVLKHVTVGADPSAKGEGAAVAVNIPEILLEPAVQTIFSPIKEFRDATVRGATLPLESLTVLPVFSENLHHSGSSIRLAHLRLESITLTFAGISLSGIQGGLDLSKKGAFAPVELRTADRSLTLSAMPIGQRVEITVEGLGLQWPGRAPVIIDSITAKGVLDNEVLTLGTVEIRSLGGKIAGDSDIRVSKKMSIAGNLRLERLNAERLFGALGLNSILSGEINGRMRYSAAIHDWNDVLSSVQADGDFSMQRGSLRGIDLVEAIRRGSGGPVQGGVTNFELLNGKIRISPKGARVTNLVMESGLMRSSGSVTIGEHQELDGRIDLQMRGSVNQTRIPIRIDGDLKSPSAQAGIQ